MRIERIRVQGFGRLQGLDTGPERLGTLVAVLGPNEAGKSTLFNFLTTVLYGFQPASRERNPHVPWGSDEAGGSVEIALSDGRCAHVHRRLRSAPTGTLEGPDGAHELRNLPLPWAEHIPRRVFRQVFAVTLADLAGLDQETWSGIQDRLVGAMGTSDLLPARAVAEALEGEASGLWRPNRRGNQKIRSIQAEIRELRQRRNAALERDRRIRALVEERENVTVRLREARGERERDRVAVERTQLLLPIKQQLLRIDALRRQGGDRAELKRLPHDPVAEARRLQAERARLQDRLSELESRLTGPEELVARLDERALSVLRRGDDLTRFLDRVRAAEASSRVLDADAEAEGVRRGLHDEAGRLLEGGWQEELVAPLTGLSVELLADRIARLTAEGASPVGEAEGAGPSPTPLLGFGAAVAVAAGVAGAAWSLFGGPQVVGAVSITLLVVGGLAAGYLMARGARARAHVAAGASAKPDTGTRAAIVDMLRGIPVRNEYLNPPGDALVSGLRRLRTLALRAADVDREAESDRQRWLTLDAEAGVVAASMGVSAGGTALELAPVLERELRDADAIRETAAGAERELAHLRRERDGVSRELDATHEAIESLERSLPHCLEGTLEERAEAARQRIDAHSRADQLLEELERTRPDLDELRRRIHEAERGGTALRLDEQELAAVRARMAEAEETIERLVGEAEALERDAVHLRDLETVDAVDSEVAALREAEAALSRQRDRKWVLAQIVRAADRRFREEHQPDLVRRASRHLARLTGGRYDRLLIDEGDGDSPFHLVGPGLPAPLPLRPPISTGTLEQAYLSLRLAIVDHLDDGRERLPLFIDEAFVNWDPQRRERGLDVLAELSADRQLFLFTCHPEMAERLQERSARLLRLER